MLTCVSVGSLEYLATTTATITSSHTILFSKKISVPSSLFATLLLMAPWTAAVRRKTAPLYNYAKYQLAITISILTESHPAVDSSTRVVYRLSSMSASPSHTPREIKKNGTSGITVRWADGSLSELPSEFLRRHCPCAACREKRGDDTHAKPLTGKKRSLMILESSLQQEIELQQIWGVGHYALGLRWGDGHDSGIYTFEYLRELGGKL